MEAFECYCMINSVSLNLSFYPNVASQLLSYYSEGMQFKEMCINSKYQIQYANSCL